MLSILGVLLPSSLLNRNSPVTASKATAGCVGFGHLN